LKELKTRHPRMTKMTTDILTLLKERLALLKEKAEALKATLNRKERRAAEAKAQKIRKKKTKKSLKKSETL